MKNTHTWQFAVATLILGFSVGMAHGAEPSGVRFDRDIRPILSNKCFQCHGPDKEHRKADLRLDLKAEAFKSRDGATAVKAGSLADSGVWERIISDDADVRMPPPDAKKDLTAAEIALLKKWIEGGAEWTEHWSFSAPKKSSIPKVKATAWTNNAIDNFIAARLEREGLKHSPEADCRTLIRRVTLDLTGLPPKPEDVEAFVNDKSANAYEKVVDRLLKSRHYGERMALMWLDAARYGDTSVFHADGPRDMWAWRDGVINAYNRNQPFDQFSIEQLAGDLLPNATVAQRVASGFNRNNGTTDEGGAIAEEYRIEYAVDRVKTTSMVWLGLTMECGQCHDHKYDPITQREYYQFFAYFNVSADGGMQTRRGNATPLVSVLDPMKEQEIPSVQAGIAAKQMEIDSHRKSVEPAFLAWVKQQEIAAKDKSLDSLPQDPLAYFTLDEGKGNQISDSVKNDRKGKINGKATWIDARHNKGLKFDGKTFIDCGNLADFERTDKFSYGGWVKIEPKASGAVLAKMDDHGGFRGYDLLISGGFLEVHIVNKWPENAIKVRTKKALEPKKWHHVFATYDGSSQAKGITIYVNGEPWEWSIEQNGLKDTIKTKKPLHLGSRNPGGRLNGELDDVRIFKRHLSEVEVQSLAGSNPLTPILNIAADKRTKQQVDTLRNHYLNNKDATFKKLTDELAKLKTREADLKKPLTSVMVMQDRMRDTFILNRGAYDQPTKNKVTANTPSILPPMSEDLPKNRLGMAKWLFQSDHPLTARVAVNRYWQLLFGTGLVTTPEDFGSQGEFPTHPELLDWLAVDFRESGWDVKRFLKQLVTSATYRQTSRVTPDVLNRDPRNLLLTRGPRFRLQGEFIRDNALILSGLLVDQPGGPGVKPYQPPGLWAEVGLGGNPKFKQDNGDKLYRRSIYTYWKRSAPPPSMQIFDAPTREKCTVRRPRTNTPLQALVTLNDVQFVEAARNLAQRILLIGGKTTPERLDFVYRLALARPPREAEVSIFEDVLKASTQQYAKDKDAAAALLSFGDSKRDESLASAEHAAWTIVASMILNMDETLTRQ